jgi:hypothetical protein
VQYALWVKFLLYKKQTGFKKMIFSNTTTSVKALPKSALYKLFVCIFDIFYLFLNIALACANAVSAS